MEFMDALLTRVLVRFNNFLRLYMYISIVILLKL